MEHISKDDVELQFYKLFERARHEMFKVEVLQCYSRDGESSSMQAWLAGDRQKALELGRKDARLIAFRQKGCQSPAVITRVHAVDYPLSDFLEWEIAVCYKDSLIRYGAESVWLADKAKLGNTRLPAGDTWIFDDAQVFQWQYKPGTSIAIGALSWDETQGDDIQEFRNLRKALLDVAVPVA